MYQKMSNECYFTKNKSKSSVSLNKEIPVYNTMEEWLMDDLRSHQSDVYKASLKNLYHQRKQVRMGWHEKSTSRKSLSMKWQDNWPKWWKSEMQMKLQMILLPQNSKEEVSEKWIKIQLCRYTNRL